MIHPPTNRVPLGPDLFPTPTGWQPNQVPKDHHPFRGVGSGPGHPRTAPYFKYNTPTCRPCSCS